MSGSGSYEKYNEIHFSRHFQDSEHLAVTSSNSCSENTNLNQEVISIKVNFN